MPASNTGSGARAVQKKTMVRRPSPVKIAQAQEQQYASQGKAVQNVANTQRKVRVRAQQLAKSKPLAGDAPQTRAKDTGRAQAYVKRQYVQQAASDKAKHVVRAKQVNAPYVNGTTVPPDVAANVKYHGAVAAHKATVAGKVAPVLKVLDQTTRPVHAIAGAADAAVTGKDVLGAASRGIQNKDRTTFSTVLKHAGVKNKAIRGVAGFALDVGLDPTTYITGGTASVAGKTADKAAAKGITVKVAGHEVPGIRKATAVAGTGGGKTFRTVVPERARNAVRDAASEVNPNVAPAGVDKATHEAARRVARTARARTNQGQRQAVNLAHGIQKQIGPKNYAQVVDAVEAGTVSALPKHLQGHATTLQGHLAAIRKVQRDAGVKVPERKGYIPRKLTPATIQAENKKAALVGGRGKVEPSSSKFRKEQRAMVEIRAAEPGRYRQDLHALVAERMAEGTASAARANMAQDLARLGHPVQRGTKVHLSEREALYKVKKGKDLQEVQPNDAKFLKPAKNDKSATYVVLNRSIVDRAVGGVASTRGGTIMHGYDKTQAGFKRIALATPGFHIRNLIGDTSQAYLHQPGYKLPGNMVRAGRVLKAAGRLENTQRGLATSAKVTSGRLKTKHYGHVSYEEAAQKLIDAGAARSGYTAKELRDLATSGDKKIKLPKSPAAVRRAFLNREDLPRLATAIHALRQGATYQGAAAKVAGAHFDYADLTPFERNVARRIMPFYTWTARNVPLQSKRLLTNPGKFAAYQKVREGAATAINPDGQDPQTRDMYKRLEAAGVKLPGGYAKYLSAYEQRNAGIPLSWKGHKFTVSAGLPLQDLNELPGAAGAGQASEYLNKAASLVTPVIKDPVEFGFNYSFFFRDQIQRDNSPLVAAPSPVGAWPAWAKKKFGVVKAIDKRSGKMIWQWPSKADYVAHAVPGLPSTAVKMMTPGHDQQGKGTTAKALGIAGVKAAPLDATTNGINLAYARQKEIQVRLAALRQQGVGKDNPSPEWRRLNDQLKLVSQIAYQGKVKRGDKVLPRAGGPPKVRVRAGGVKLNGAGSNGVTLNGAGPGRVKLN